MSLFDNLKPGARLRGLAPGGVAEVVSVSRFGADALNLIFRADGRVGERLVYRGEEAAFEFVDAGRAYAFDADGGLLRLASEANRIRLAHLFDPYLAVSASQIEALPHQITAVYAEMLPRQPLRFLLADDPGAGKTVMAGLLIKELMIRGDLERCLIVAPGSLVEQWQEEMAEKFGLGFDLLTRDQVESSITGNPFIERNRLIMRLDMAARSDELKAKLQAAPDWDLIICDEAHRMAASYFGGEVKETQRHKLGKLLGTRTRNLLLMSATPHNGKEADFQLFMGLLDADRFEGRFREGVHKADVSDMMRRLTKEELYRFDGTPLFPERLAYTANYELSPDEADLYAAVTTYVREEMNRADRGGDGSRRSSVGFALQILQRRLASSPAAIHRSLERRRKRLEERLREERMGRGAGPLTHTPALPSYDPDDLDEATGEENEAAEEAIVDAATAAQTLAELEAEIVILRDLEERALRLKLSGQDAKWRELESILDEPMMMDPATGLRRKILIFTEPKDTLEYLQQKITSRFGDAAAVTVIHGGVAREARRAAIAAFNSDPVVRVMIANDAAGEGVNLQRGAHLMVNYDLPWNPNRLEQRFGRIHRIGQTEVCHLWNLCASNTREGEVYGRLLEKLKEAREALGGRVFDVLGELFEGHALRDLLVDAIRYGDRPETKAELFRKVDGAVDVGAIEQLVAERKLTSEGMDPNAVTAVREEMERAQARRLQPHFIGSFFREAFTLLGGRIAEREKGRFEITRVPSVLKERDRLIGRGDPVLDRYARVTFEKALIPGQPQAELLAPGHPLLDAAVDVVLERFGPLLGQGAVLVDETDARRGARRQGAADQRLQRRSDRPAPGRAAAQAAGGARPRAPDHGLTAGPEGRGAGDPTRTALRSHGADAGAGAELRLRGPGRARRGGARGDGGGDGARAFARPLAGRRLGAEEGLGHREPRRCGWAAAADRGQGSARRRPRRDRDQERDPRLAERARRLPPGAGQRLQRLRAPARLRAALLPARTRLWRDSGGVQHQRFAIDGEVASSMSTEVQLNYMGARKAGASTESAKNSRHVRITGGGLRNHLLYIPLDFFPDDAVGGSNKQEIADELLTISFDGARTVRTDIDGEKRILRDRGAVGEFMTNASLQEGDLVLITRLGPYHYLVAKA